MYRIAGHKMYLSFGNFLQSITLSHKPTLTSLMPIKKHRHYSYLTATKCPPTKTVEI